MNSRPPEPNAASPVPPQLREYRMLRGEAVGLGALVCVLAIGVVAMQCNRPGQQPTPATVTATPLSTVVVVGPTQAPRTSTPRATPPHLPLGGSGGLLGR